LLPSFLSRPKAMDRASSSGLRLHPRHAPRWNRRIEPCRWRAFRLPARRSEPNSANAVAVGTARRAVRASKEAMMKVIGKLAIAASAVLWISAAAAQDEETTTTTRTNARRPAAPWRLCRRAGRGWRANRFWRWLSRRLRAPQQNGHERSYRRRRSGAGCRTRTCDLLIFYV
jgi:hypothetical protein